MHYIRAVSAKHDSRKNSTIHAQNLNIRRNKCKQIVNTRLKLVLPRVGKWQCLTRIHSRVVTCELLPSAMRWTVAEPWQVKSHVCSSLLISVAIVHLQGLPCHYAGLIHHTSGISNVSYGIHPVCITPYLIQPFLHNIVLLVHLSTLIICLFLTTTATGGSSIYLFLLLFTRLEFFSGQWNPEFEKECYKIIF